MQQDKTVETTENTSEDTALKPKKSIFPRGIDVVVIILLFFIAQVGVALVLRMCGFELATIETALETNVETHISEQISRGKTLALLYPLSMVVAIVLVVTYVTLRTCRAKGRIKMIRCALRGFNPNIILFSFLWLLTAQIVAEPIAALLPEVSNDGIGRGMWACITAVVFAPILEEVLCRGIILDVLRHRWGATVAVLLSALFFGLVHVEPATALPAVLAGVVLGITYVRTGSVIATIVLHSMNNALAFSLLVFGLGDTTLRETVGNEAVYWTIYAVALLIFLAVAATSFRRLRSW